MSPPKASLSFDEPIGIVGAGPAGLVTAQVLLRDGFTNVQLITRDESVGGIWSRGRIYSGLMLNNVHGEFRFSALPMHLPPNAEKTGGRLSGEVLSAYMEEFASTFVKDRIRFRTEVLSIRRGATCPWVVHVRDLRTNSTEELKFSRIVVCTGGCSAPKFPPSLSPNAAQNAGFLGLVIHSAELGARLGDILAKLNSTHPEPLGEDKKEEGAIVVVGGGKSAQDTAANLANAGRKVTIVYSTLDSFLATPKPLPNFLRKGRLFTVLSPNIELKTWWERFMHTTWLGSKIIHFIWGALAQRAFNAYSIPQDSPLRHTASLFWETRTNDEGVVRDSGFHALVNAGKIEVRAPARAVGYGDDGRSVVLSSGEKLKADVVVLATGYTSSWSGIFDEKTAKDLGIDRHAPQTQVPDEWSNYKTLANPPPHLAARQTDERAQWSSTIYRGLVPAKNINKRDFAINGATFTTNKGYAFEAAAHWISSYFLFDTMRLPSTPEAAIAHAEREAAWWRKRFPGIYGLKNESYSAAIQVWSWPQAVDSLLEDMYLPSQRSGGNWFTWPFKVVDVDEIRTLGEERRARRMKDLGVRAEDTQLELASGLGML